MCNDSTVCNLKQEIARLRRLLHEARQEASEANQEVIRLNTFIKDMKSIVNRLHSEFESECKEKE